MASSLVNAPVSDRARPLTGREYLRVSLDRSGRARSTGEQHEDNLRDARSVGVTLGEPYRDDSRSASRYATKVRDDFERLMSDLRSESFGAQVLWLWESSRGSRKVGEWVELIEECERNVVLIRVTTHGRYYDPTNPRDRRSLLEDAVDSEYESSKVSLRSKRASAASAIEGRPHGQVPYGYVRRYDERTRQYVAQEPHPDEAPIVAELFERIVKGHSLRSIARDFAGRGVERRSGGPFSAKHLRTLALNPSYAALRVHRPRSRGVPAGLVPAEQVTTTEGRWEAIVSRSVFFQVGQKLADPARVTTRPGRARHLLSMIARCAECGSVLTATRRANVGRQYQCHLRGCVRVGADDLDAIAEQAVIGYLSRPDVYRALRQESDDGDDERAVIRDEIAALHLRLDELADAVASGAVSMALAARSEPQILAKLRDAERREQELATPAVLRGILSPDTDVAKHWDDVPISARRELARMLLSPELLGVLSVRCRPEGHRGGNRPFPVDERIAFTRQADSASSPSPYSAPVFSSSTDP